jgi:beta-glucanase (GH16 family)
MRRPFALLSALAVFASSCAARKPSSDSEPASEPESDRPGWTLVWSDEFDGNAIDPENWTFDIGGGGWGNSEWEFYTNRPENARLEDGNLVIEARAEKFQGRDYTSARLKTQGLQTWTYGRIEARMQLPQGQGIWPAFWMLGSDIPQAGWPACGEIDIMEFVGRDPTHIYGTVHGPGYSGGGGVGGSTTVPVGSTSDGFHVYAIEWEPQEIRWYLDEAQSFRVRLEDLPGRWVFDHPFFIILNLAVGGGWPGYPDESTVFPQYLRVDYVRVYQNLELAGEAPAGAAAMHIGSISVDAQENEDGSWIGVAELTIVDGQGGPVEGARVSGGWSGVMARGEAEGVTDTSGRLRLQSEPIRRDGEVTFCVTGINHARYSYDKDANERSCARAAH